MKLLRDEQAYRQIVDDFVAKRVNARSFMLRFRHLWDCDRAEGVDGVRAMQHAGSGLAGLYGFLDSIGVLCATYGHCLPADSGYRVSEEQFRKEVEGLVSAWPDTSPADALQAHGRDGERPLF